MGRPRSHLSEESKRKRNLAARMRHYYLNRDEERAKVKEYYQKNKEKIKAAQNLKYRLLKGEYPNIPSGSNVITDERDRILKNMIANENIKMEDENVEYVHYTKEMLEEKRKKDMERLNSIRTGNVITNNNSGSNMS